MLNGIGGLAGSSCHAYHWTYRLLVIRQLQQLQDHILTQLDKRKEKETSVLCLFLQKKNLSQNQHYRLSSNLIAPCCIRHSFLSQLHDRTALPLFGSEQVSRETQGIWRTQSEVCQKRGRVLNGYCMAKCDAPLATRVLMSNSSLLL